MTGGYYWVKLPDSWVIAYYYLEDDRFFVTGSDVPYEMSQVVWIGDYISIPAKYKESTND